MSGGDGGGVSTCGKRLAGLGVVGQEGGWRPTEEIVVTMGAHDLIMPCDGCGPYSLLGRSGG